MRQLVTTRETKEKKLIRKESNKFANQFNVTSKEIDMKDKVIEVVKDIKKEETTQGLNRLKITGNKNSTWTIRTKN